MSQLQVVNGYVCFNCADVALAKKDINPAHPPGSPSNPTGATGPNPGAPGTTGASPTGSSNTQPSSAVSFGGSLAQLNGTQSVNPSTGAQSATGAPQPTYQPGSQLNAFA